MDFVDFLFQFALILTITKILGIIMRKLGFPQVLGFIVAGILIGPAIWGAIFPLNGSELFPITSGEHNPYLKAFAEVGVIFVMFTAGLETDLEEIKKTGFAAFMIAFAGVLVPLGAGTLLASIFLPQLTWHSWIFVGTIMTATSVGITVEVLRELGKLKTKIGTIIMNAAVIDDVLGIMVLSVVLSISGGNSASNNLLGVINPNNIPVISILWILLFFVVAVVAGVAFAKLFKYIEKKSPHTRRLPIFSIALCLMYAFIAEKGFGVADITGAYIAGLVLSTNVEAQYVDRKVTINSYTLFAPIFFANIGIQISFSGFDSSVILFSILFVIFAILSKIIACGGVAKIFGAKTKDCLRIGMGMIVRGEVALIVTQKGVAGGLIAPEYLTMTVLLVLVTSVFAPIILKLLYKKNDEDIDKNIQDNGNLVGQSS